MNVRHLRILSMGCLMLAAGLQRPERYFSTEWPELDEPLVSLDGFLSARSIMDEIAKGGF